MAESVYFRNFIESSEKIRVSTRIQRRGVGIGLWPAFSEAGPQPLTSPDLMLQQKSFVTPL